MFSVYEDNAGRRTNTYKSTEMGHKEMHLRDKSISVRVETLWSHLEVNPEKKSRSRSGSLILESLERKLMVQGS